ncbi:TetR/AcrR family transcriptional regulator [Flindersiella endophytica]
MTERTRRPYRRAEQTRRHVLDVAAKLFYANGVHAVGTDRLASEAGVTVATLYRLFGSKDGLVTAYLREADQEWFNWLERTVEAGGLVHVVEELDRQAREADCRGCPFRLVLAEYPAADSEVHCVAVDTKARTLARLRELATSAGLAEPGPTAERLMLVIEGIWATAAERGPGSPPGAGPALARSLLTPVKRRRAKANS